MLYEVITLVDEGPVPLGRHRRRQQDVGAVGGASRQGVEDDQRLESGEGRLDPPRVGVVGEGVGLEADQGPDLAAEHAVEEEVAIGAGAGEQGRSEAVRPGEQDAGPAGAPDRGEGVP